MRGIKNQSRRQCCPLNGENEFTGDLLGKSRRFTAVPEAMRVFFAMREEAHATLIPGGLWNFFQKAISTIPTAETPRLASDRYHGS
jgi:hypothetical protein